MADPKTAEFRFGLTGLTTKQDPALLGDGAYRSISNMEVVQEGTVSTRAGRKNLGNGGMTSAIAYKIQKVRAFAGEDPATPSLNSRYIGIQGPSGQDLWLTQDYSAFTKVSPAINTPLGAGDKRFQLADYGAGQSGNSWAYIASELKMVKDRGDAPLVPGTYSELPRWGILPALGVSLGTASGAGNLDGGDGGSPAGSTPYDWRFTYQSKDTGSEGNPTQVCLTPTPLNLKSATVFVYGSNDPQISKINIYRRGGLLFDDWRRVGQVDNPGWGGFGPFVIPFTDNIADADLVFASLLETDNDPPVTSATPVPLTSTLSAPVAIGFATGTFTGWPLTTMNPGTLVHILDPTTPEDVVVAEDMGGGSFLAFFQIAHAAGTPIEIDSITAQPCSLAMVYSPQNAVIVAGDPVNPHILYMSKSGNPEAFPVIAADGSNKRVGAGTPSNGIVNFCEFRGQIVTLNNNSIFETIALQGSLIQPAEVAKKGLAAREAFCKTDTEIWFLTPNEGVWSWDGSTCRKRCEAIDPIFHGQEFNGIPPMSTQPDLVSGAVMVAHRGQIIFIYWDINGNRQMLLCEPNFNDRWRSYTVINPAVTIAYTEPDTGSTIWARSEPVNSPVFTMDDQSEVIAGANYTSDNFTTHPIDGVPIPFDMLLPWVDLGTPYVEKLFEEVYLELDDTNSEIGTATVTVDLLTDYSDTPVNTFTVAVVLQGRRLISLLPGLSLSPPQSFGIEARAISFHIHGQAFPARIQFFKLSMRLQETGMLTAGACADWTDLGSKHDKRLYQMTVVFDTAGVNRTIVLEGMGGRDGATIATPQDFTLNNPTITGAGRCMKVIPLASPTILKLVRVRAFSTVGSTTQAAEEFFKILEVTFPDMEQYPPDVVNVTPWENGGTEYDKYANQITLEVNTNGVAVQFQLQADGSNIGPALTVTSTEADRQRNITLPSGLIGKRWRVFVDLAQNAFTVGAGMWQLFSHSFKFQPADEGVVAHTGDWTSLDYDFDKMLYTVDVSWDNTGGAPVTLQLDIINGINGQTEVDNTQQLTLSGGRSRKVFAITPDTIAKMVRLHPVGAVPTTFREWKFVFQKEDLPPDVVCYTPWFDGGYEYLKYANQVDLEVDTANASINVQLQADGATVYTFSIQSTFADRRRNITVPANLIGKKWRLLIDPTQTPLVDGSGKFQLWQPVGYKFQQADRGEVIHTGDWDTLGWMGDKYLRTITIEWQNDGGADVTMVLDLLGGILGQTLTSAVATFVLSGGRSRRVFPLQPDMIAKMIRLYPQGGTLPIGFKAWKYEFDKIDYPADIVRSVPWQDAVSPNDKNPSWLFIDADTQGVAAVVQLKNESGTVMTVNHTGTVTDRKRNYPIQADVFAKMWRLLADEGTGGKFQLFTWGFDRWKPTDLGAGADPPEVVLWTPWTDLGYPYGKIARNLILTIDTGGVPCTIDLQTGEAGTVQTFPVTSSYTDRKRVIACNFNLVGELWRLLLHPGTNGKTKLWDWGLDYVKEPAAVTEWSSYEQAFGYAPYKVLKMGWFQYKCAGSITVTVVSDTGTFSITLPPHAGRTSERFYFSTVFGSGLNKSLDYDISIVAVDPASPFTLYADNSWLEWFGCGVDRHAAYQKMVLSEMVQIPI